MFLKKLTKLLALPVRFVKSMGKFCVGLVCGGKDAWASEEVRVRRLGVCEGCGLFDREMRRCEGCGCFVDLKVFMATETCPQNKWKEEYVWKKVLTDLKSKLTIRK